ncbi:MAG TPA: pseudouridine synthase, partial [Planctomycetaceae bacterium]|nr:pseudouridine synthase [Planctomycetaceae bacterium]
MQRVLASAGFGSRRSCEEIITDGRVQIDKKVVTELGTRVDPNTQTIKVDGETLRRPRLSYYMVNKPLGVLSTNSDPDGRSRVIDLIGDRKHLFPVGRLDKESQGLILVT